MSRDNYYPDTLDGEQFQPYLDKGTVQGLIQHYKNDPEPFDEDKLKQVELHAQHYKLPFARTDTDQHGRVAGILSQAGAGFWSGFTTFNVGEEPRDEWEGIARSIGHLAGFVGFIPSIPRKLYKFLPKASKLKTMSEAMKKVQGKSVPMLGAKAVQDRVAPIANKALATAMATRGGATNTAAEFLNQGLVKDLIGGAFHLGVASSISTWQGGVDEMMRSFIGGAETGFVFRGIGNIAQTGSKAADTSIRMIASSAYTGLPATMRGATTPEQVYEYLLGAYFGFKEMPYHVRESRQLIAKAVKDGKAGQPIELMTEFGEMDKTTQKTTIEMAEKIWGEVSEAGGITPITGNIMAYELMSKFGFKFEEAQSIAKEYMERGGTLTDIEPFLTKEMLDKVERSKAEKGSQEDLDMEVSTDTESYMSVQQKVVNYVGRTLGYKYKDMEPREQQDAILEDATNLQTTWLEILKKQRADIAQGRRDEQPEPYHVTHEVLNEQPEGKFPGHGPLRPSDNRKIELYVDATTIQGDPNSYKVGMFGRYGNYTVDWAAKMPFQGDHPGAQIGGGTGAHTGANLSGILATMRKFEGYGGRIELTSDVSYLTRVLNGHNPKGILGKDNMALWNQHKGEFFRLKKSITDAGGSIVFKTIGNTKKAKDPRGKTKAQRREIEGIEYAHRFAGTHRRPSEWSEVDYSFDVKPAGATNNMMEYLAEKLKVAPTEEDWNFWRNREIQSLQLSNQPVISASIDWGGKINVYNLDPSKPMNLAGNLKFIKQEPLSMEDAYERAYVREGFDPGELRGGAIHQFLDHAVVQDSYSGKTKEVSLLRLKQHFFGEKMRQVGELDEANVEYTYRDAVEGAEKAFNSFLYKIMDSQWTRKSGRTGAPNKMYYYGGRGDAERLYFVKVHPTVAGIRTMGGDRLTSVLNEMKKISTKIGNIEIVEGGKKRTVKLRNIFDAEWALFQNTVNKGRDKVETRRGNEMFAEAFLSNIMYELDMNGFEMKKGIRPSEIKKFFKIVGDGDFIDSAKAFNKRAQIWLNTGVSQNSDFIIPALKAEGWDDDVTAVGRANVLIINDRKMADKMGVAAKNLEEGTDGALFMTPEYMLATNSDMGLPNEGHSNKSFIVSPHKTKGAILGKYMIHEADPAMTEFMRKEKVHIIAYHSGLKQIGTRKTSDVYYKNDAEGYTFSKGWRDNIHTISMGDIKTVITEKTDNHFLQPQKIPKQMQSNLTEFSFNPVDPKVIDDFFQTTSGQRFLGKTEVNNVAEKYLVNPNKGDEKYLLDNMDSIGIPTMLKLIKSPNHTGFTIKAYKHMLSKEQEVANEEFQEGEIEKAVFDMQNDTRQEYRSAHDIIMSLSSDKSLAASMHKAVKHYRSNVIRNYILGQVTRPKIGNSFISRMRPYTPWMWEQRGKYGATARLNEKDGDKLFFLDEGFRVLKIKSHIFGGKVSGRLGEMELGKAWEDYVDGKFDKFPKLKSEFEDVLEAVIMRVPMDSMSGARVLQFGGFTGVDGLGILLHPRVMRALGGADLDGDKAWGFFGGRKESGEGEGFKSSWKKMYKDQVEEYGPVGTSAKQLKDPKTGKFYYEYFIDDANPNTADRIENPGLRWSPMARMTASMGAAQGRNMLGPAVVNKAVIMAAYAEIQARPNKNYTYTYEDYQGNKRLIKMFLRDDPVDRKRQREMGKVSIHLPADPMDEGGLKDMNSFFSLMADAHFKYVDVTNPKSHTKLSSDPKSREWMGEHGAKRAGLQQHFSKINQVLYGRNWAEERRWTPGEIHSVLNSSYDALHHGEVKGGLFKNLADVFHGLDWTEGIFHRIDEPKLRQLYKDFHKEWEDNRELQEILQRTGKSVWDDRTQKFNKLLEFVMTRKLHDERILASYLTHSKSNEKLLEAFPEYHHEGYNPKSIRQRERILRQMVHKAEDFIVNDLSDMASMRFIRKFIEPIIARENPAGEVISKEKIILGLHHRAEEIKKQSYFRGIDRRNENTLQGNEFELTTAQREFFKLMGLEREVEERDSAMLDQFQIDAKIMTLKKNMTDPEKRLFDAFMLGTLRKGTQVEVNKAIEKAESEYTSEEKFPPQVVEGIELLRQEGAKTSLSNLGFVSSSVSTGMKKAFWKEYEALFDKSVNFFTKSEEQVFKNDAKKGEKEISKEEPTSILDKDGKIIKGTALEDATFDTETQKYLEEAHPFNGILASRSVKGPKFKLKGEAMEIVLSLQEHFRNKFNNMTGRNMNELVRKMFNKNINDMNLDDWRTMDNILSEIDGGQWWRKTMKYVDDNEYLPSMTAFHHHLFPEATNKDMMRKEIMLVAKRGIYKDKHGNVLTGNTAEPTQMGEILQQFINMNKEWATGVHEQRKNQISNELSPYLESIAEGPMFWRLAVRKMESGMVWHLKEKFGNDVTWGIIKEAYEKPWTDIQKKHNWKELQEQTFTITTKEGSKNMSGREIVEKITDKIEEWNKKNHELIRGNEEVIDSYLSMIGRSYHSDSKSRKVWKKADNFINDKENHPNFRVEDKNEEKYLNEVFQKTFWWGISGKKTEAEIKKAQQNYQGLFNQYRQEKYIANIRGLAAVLDYRNQLKFSEGKENMQDSRRKMMNKLFKDILDSNEKGEPFHTKLGIDGLRIISREIMLSQIPDPKDREAIANSMGVHTTGQYPSRIYFPHLMFDRKIAQGQMERAMELIMADPNKDVQEKNREMDRLLFHTRQLTGDWVPNNDVSDKWNALNDGLQRIGEKRQNRLPQEHMNWFKTHKRAGNQYTRNSHIPGWNIEFEAYVQYMKNLTDVHYQLISQLMSRASMIRWNQRMAERFEHPDTKKVKKEDQQLINRWNNFFNLYISQSMGLPTQIPEHILADPGMKIKGTPYAWFADSEVKKRMNKIAKKLGLDKNLIKEKFPEVAEEFPEMAEKFDFADLQRWSALEAKYELAALLAHPKSSVTNLFGGTVNTLISTGWTHFKNARNVEFLQKNVNPKFTKRQDWEDWVIKLGVVEEFLLYEAGINPKFKSGKWKNFFEDAFAKLNKDPNMADATMTSLAKSHGITESVFNKAAWFMRRPERTLRRDAFLAHYLQAREKFGGAFQKFDNPILIQMAKKGVKGTQFLYSAPFRPPFSASAAGKVFTRFQTWAWNSVRFRREIIEDANARGWREGSVEFDRFKRMATADLFMMGMANLFLYSIFDNALPAPWNWLQDTADSLFGDEQERERAFFGHPLGPAQIITPPVMRLFPELFKAMIEDDYTKLAGYTIPSYFPFGRMGRDVFGPGGLYENPYRGIEKVTGFPYMQGAREFGKYRDESKHYPKGLLELIYEPFEQDEEPSD